MICHSALRVERRFDVRLPRLTFLNLYLADAQSTVDGLRPVSEEDRAGVGNERLGRAIFLYRLVEYGEKSVEVLPAGNRAGEHRPRVVLH